MAAYVYGRWLAKQGELLKEWDGTRCGRRKLMQTLVESSTDSRMVMMNPSELLGYNVVQTTQMPSSSPYALLFGNFSDALLGFYSGLDVVVDPYASAGNATTNLYFYQDVDVAVAHAESFAAAQDVTVA